jgi:hypothetical protein
MSNQYNKYNNSKIYKIWSPQTELIYIGSTTQKYLCQRLTNHIVDYNNYNKNKKKFISSFHIIKYGDYKIELLETFECNNKEELNKREGELQREYRDICVNIQIAGRTKQEYCEDNKEQIAEQKKKYREEHKEQIAEKEKKYRDEHKEQVADYHIKYYEEHKEQVAEKQKIYYEENKEKILEQQAQLYQCECGSICRYGEKARHFKTKKHQNYINSQSTSSLSNI